MAYQDTTEHHTDAEKAGFWGIVVVSGALGLLMLISLKEDFGGNMRSVATVGTLACLAGYVSLALT